MKVTAAERRALLALDLSIPRHPEDLWRRDRVRFSTLQRLCSADAGRPALARRLELKTACIYRMPYWPFYVLTAEGLSLRDGARL